MYGQLNESSITRLYQQISQSIFWSIGHSLWSIGHSVKTNKMAGFNYIYRFSLIHACVRAWRYNSFLKSDQQHLITLLQCSTVYTLYFTPLKHTGYVFVHVYVLTCFYVFTLNQDIFSMWQSHHVRTILRLHLLAVTWFFVCARAGVRDLTWCTRLRTAFLK